MKHTQYCRYTILSYVDIVVIDNKASLAKRLADRAVLTLAFFEACALLHVTHLTKFKSPFNVNVLRLNSCNKSR